MRKIFLFVAILFASFALGAETVSWTHGFETGTAWSGSNTSNRVVSAAAKRTGEKGHFAMVSKGSGRLIKGGSVNYDKDNTYTVMCWMKLSVAGKVGINVANAGGNDFELTADTWMLIYKQFTASSTQEGKNIQPTCSISAAGYMLVDDVVFYKGTIDLDKPSAPTSPTGLTTKISWTNGTDDNTGIQNTLIWHRTEGADEDLTLNDQGVYAVGDKDESGHWTLVTASVAADATSYDGAFPERDVYAIVHRDLAYNYSTPTYTAITNPLSDWEIIGEFFKKEGGGYALPVGMTQSGDIVSTTIHMYANGRCEFHIERGGVKYTNWAAVPMTATEIPMVSGGDGSDCVVYPGPEGDYLITYNTSTHRVSVTFPEVEHPCPNYVYFVKPSDWDCVRIYNYKNDGMRMSEWGKSPYLTKKATICGKEYYYCSAYPASFDYIIWRDDSGHQSASLNTAAGLGKYFDFINPYSWNSFSLSSISFDNNGGEGSMASITEICPNTDQALPACTFVKSGYDFSHWTANVDVKVGGVTVPAGNPISNGATLQDISDKNIILTAVWEAKPATILYILGYCYVKDNEWIQGQDGAMKAWQYMPFEESLKETEHILFDLPGKASIYFNSKDLTLLGEPSAWGKDQTDNRAIKAFAVKKETTQTFDLNGMEASKITFYAFPGSNSAYDINLTVGGVTETKSFAANKKDKWHKFPYEGTFTGEFSIAGGTQDTRMVVVVDVPQRTITFDANGGTGSMDNQIVPKGATCKLDINHFSRTDHIFLGWTEDPLGSGTLYTDEATYSTLTDVTLYAKWEKIIRSTINFDATGAYNHYTASAVATYLQPMPDIPTLPLRTGYVFEGYYDGPNGTGTQYYTGLGTGVRDWNKTISPVTLYAKWSLPCDLAPTLTNNQTVVTMWDGKKIDESIVTLTCDFDTTGLKYSLQSAVPSVALTGDLHFEYFDGQIHIMGTSAWGNTTAMTFTVDFTIANDCEPARTYTVSSTVCVYPATQLPRVAFIITGTEGGAFDAYDTDDATACNDLVTYLRNFYDVTFVNGYSTKDEAALATYYANYDLLVVTDFLDTGKGYTNAIGTLIDKKPILSFEAYVANQSNWHIGSNPTDPKPKVQEMKVLCAGHDIFTNAKYLPSDATETQVVNPTDTTVHVLDALSSETKAKGLQGFVINEAPDFIFLATVRDTNNTRDLIVCCERQVVFHARLLLYGINFYEMPNLSKAGKIIMRQMIDYLLMTDETKIADCSLVFDDNNNTHVWSDPKNWAPGYNIVPTPVHPTRIIAECHVDYDAAHAGSVKVNTGRDKHGYPVNGKLIIEPTGGLTIAGMVATVHDTRYASPITIAAKDLLIKADAEHNGAFVYGNKESDVRATVQYYSRGTDAKTANPVWQYIGIPFQAGQTAIQMYHKAWMCRWASGSTDGIGGLWQWVDNEDVLLPFEGYCLTQETAKTYEFSGKLNPPVTTTLVLDNRDAEGYAFAANSWTAPIKISQMQDADFVNVEKSIYIYHSGTYAQWNTNKDEIINTAASDLPVAAGQYVAIPIHSSPYIGVDSVIPAMQGFFVQTTDANAKLRLVYNRTVYDGSYFKTSTQPMRTPRRGDRPEVMQLIVSGENYGDRVHILARDGFSENFEDGWDGRKIEGDENAPMLAVVKEAGDMAVAAIESLEERELSFRAGNETEYTFCFNYEGETIYLYDRLADQAVEIKTGNTYSFTAENKTAAKRFIITKNPPRVPTGIEDSEVSVQGSEAEKCIIDGQLYIIKDNRFYDARGVRVHSFNRKEVTP